MAERLKRYALALTRDVHEADDLAQQTIASLLVRGSMPEDPHAYAITSVTRLWISRQRSIRRSAARLALLAVGQPRSARPDGEAERWEEHAAIDQAVQRLPPIQRAVFVLRVVEELDYPGIAAALECDVGAVRASLHLARTRLKATLAEIRQPRDRAVPDPTDSSDTHIRSASQQRGRQA